MELEYELAFMATFCWTRSRLEGMWNRDILGSWKRQVVSLSTWNKVWGPAGGLWQTKGCVTSLDTSMFFDVLLDCRVIAPSDI